MKEFLKELQRRNVYKVAVAYAIVGWLVIQVSSTVLPTFHAPEWVVQTLVVVVLLGFPIALVLAWAFELTPEGIKRSETVAPNEYIRQWSTRKFAGLIVFIALLAAGLLAFQLVRNRSTSGRNATGSVDTSGLPRPTISSAQKSIAVLPLLNESGNPGDEYFSDGLSEELISALAQIKELKVIGRSSSFRFKDQKEDSKTIGDKLGVNTLLEGTVRKQGEKVRIVAELVNVADGIELWSRTFDRELKDIFAVQAEIAQAVAASLELTLLGAKEKSTKNATTKSVDAHNAYLQGHFYFERRNLEDYRKSVGFFDQAIRLDPDYALAYAERSEAWTWITDKSSEKQEEARASAGRDAEKAVAIGPDLAEAHAALGWVRAFVEWKFSEGLAELRRAQQLAPENPTANDLLARVVVYLGQFEEAEKLARHAIEIDPLNYQGRNNLARILFVEGKLDEADAEAHKAAELQPTAAGSHRWQVIIAIHRGDGEAALHEAQLEPDEGYRHFELALAQYARGDRAAADAALAELIAKDAKIEAYQIAEVYAWRGDTEKAFEWLEIAFDNHDTGMLSLLIDPLTRSLRHDARYKAMLTKMDLPVSL